VTIALSPGTGRATALGGFEGSAEESFQVAVTFVSANVARLRKWLPAGARTVPSAQGVLYRKQQDLSLLTPWPQVPKDGASGTAAFVLAVTAVTGRSLRGKVAVTGSMDLEGRLRPVQDTEGKTRAAMQGEVRTGQGKAGRPLPPRACSQWVLVVRADGLVDRARREL
jgi:ATP-dependent Lon protease